MFVYVVEAEPPLEWGLQGSIAENRLVSNGFNPQGTIASADGLASTRCAHCTTQSYPVAFSMAFQPIVDVEMGRVFAYEALVRGLNGEPADSILSLADDTNRYALDQGCRVKAIEMAAELGVQTSDASLCINFYPNAIYNPATCLRKTIETTSRTGFPLHRLIFEITEGEKVEDHDHLKGIIREYKARGMRVAIDDFGAGYAGLNMLANFQPDILKIDRELTREADKRRASRVILKSIVSACQDLDIEVIAEGLETADEVRAMRDLGIRYLQGYYFARPGFARLPAVDPALLVC